MTRSRSSRGSAVVATLLLAGGSGAAFGQALPLDQTLVPFERYTSVRERHLTGYDVAPLPVGSFSVQPAVSVSANYNDNVFATDHDRQSDVFVRLSPAVSATSDWSRSLLNLSVAADIDRYTDLTTENTVNLNTSAYGTHDLGENGRLRGLIRFETQRESRESEDVFVQTLRPVRFSRLTGAIGFSRLLAKTLLSVEGNIYRNDFQDARLRDQNFVVDEDFRDSTRKTARARAEFGQSPALAYFVQATYSNRSYRLDSTTATAAARGSNIWEVLAGARFELPILARGEIGVGYTRGSYGSSQFNSFSGVAINSQLTLFPTQLTNIIINASRSVTDSGLPTSAGYTNLNGGIRVDHELLRQLILSGGISYQRENFNGVDRVDRRISFDAGANYRIGRHMSASVSYQRYDLSSHGADRYKSFLSNRAVVGCNLRI